MGLTIHAPPWTYTVTSKHYRKTFIARAIHISKHNCKYRIVLPEELIAITETDMWEYWQRISRYRYIFFLECQMKFQYRYRLRGRNECPLTQNYYLRELTLKELFSKCSNLTRNSFKRFFFPEDLEGTNSPKIRGFQRGVFVRGGGILYIYIY